MARREQDFYPTPDETIEAFLDVFEIRGEVFRYWSLEPVTETSSGH